MMYPQKQEIKKALQGSTFSASAKTEYLQNSQYRLKKRWLEGLETNSEISRYFNPRNSLTAIQHLNYMQLCMCELEKCAVENEEIQEYYRLLDIQYNSNVTSKSAKIKELINRKEVKLMKQLTLSIMASQEDVRSFLRMAMLFGDKAYAYDLEAKEGLTRLCGYIIEA